jgi:hypothetical protein
MNFVVEGSSKQTTEDVPFSQALADFWTGFCRWEQDKSECSEGGVCSVHIEENG